MISKLTDYVSLIHYHGSSSRWVGYGFALLAVIFAGFAIHYLPVIGDWGRGGLLLFFFSIILIAFWFGINPGLFALMLSLVGVNSLLLPPVWVSNPYDALFLNSGFCLLSFVIIAITHRHHIEALALLESKQDLDLAQSVAQVGSWRFKTDQDKVFWTDEKYRIFEIDKRTEVTIDTFFSAIHPEDREYVELKWQACLNGEPYDIEHRIIVAGDKVKWIREKATLHFDGNGDVLGGFGITQDITERKQSEAQMQAIIERYELVLEGAQDAIWDWDVINKRVHYSARWKALRGYDDDEIGTDEKEWVDHIHPEDKASVLAAVQAHFEGRSSVFYEEYRVLCKDGTWKWIIDRGIAKRNLLGQVFRMAGSENDITARKLVEKELYDRENQLNLIMNLTPALISYLDADLRYIRVNKTYEDWFALAEKEIVGRTVPEIVGEQTWKVVQPYLERALKGEQVTYEHRLTFQHNAAARWVKVTLVPDSGPGGDVKGIVEHVADIEERKLHEEALMDAQLKTRLATEATGVGIWAWNVLTNEIRWDRQMFDIFGISPTKNLCVNYSTWSSAVVSEDLAKQEELLQHLIQTQGDSFREYRIQRSDGKSIRYIEAVDTVRTNAQGQTEWVLGTNFDITDRKNAEQALIDRENELQLIINSMPALIAYIDPEFRYLRANKTYLHWLGIPKENIIGKQIIDVVGETAWLKIKPFMKKAMSGEQVHYELQMPYKSAKPRWIHANYVPDKDSNGNVKGVIALIVDIGEIKQAEQEIAKLNKSLLHRVEELQAIFDATPIGIAIADDPEGRHIRGNPAIEQMIGLPPYTDLSLKGKYKHPYKAYRDGRELDITELPMQMATRGEIVENKIFDIVRPDSKTITVMSKTVPLFDENRIPRGAVGAFMDITDLKKSELALKNSEERLRLAQKAGQLGIFDQNLDSGEMQWDKRLRELWGVKPDERLVTDTCMASVHPDDRAQVYAAVNRSFDPKGSGEYHAEYRIIRPTDNQVFWVAAYGITTFNKDRPVRLVGFVQDISKRKRAEAALKDTETRLTLALDELKAGFWDWDLKTNEVLFSTIWKQQLGYAENELKNRYEEWEKRLHPDDLSNTMEAINSHLNGFQPNFEIEFRLLHKDGSYRWIHSRAASYRDENNRPVRMVGIHLDVTDYKLAKEMNLHRDKMEEAFRLNVASQTVAAIAHELNQPLTAITYFSDVAVDMIRSGHQNTKKVAEILENCSIQAQRAGHVIKQLMALLQKGEFLGEPLDLNKIVNYVYEYINKNKHLNSLVFDLKLASDLPKVLANSLQIQKILIILVNNSLEAIQETGNTSGMLTITTRLYSSSPAMVQITVCDNGIGVTDSKMLNKIFQPFYTSKSSGLGMGLAISKALIEAYGGKMWADQNPDTGISVHFTLPFAT